jgi:hypothetical protein
LRAGGGWRGVRVAQTHVLGSSALFHRGSSVCGAAARQTRCCWVGPGGFGCVAQAECCDAGCGRQPRLGQLWFLTPASAIRLRHTPSPPPLTLSRFHHPPNAATTTPADTPLTPHHTLTPPSPLPHR